MSEEREHITLPCSISISDRRISTIIDDVISKKKDEVLTWVGSNEIIKLIYIYLFKKYGHNCLFVLSIEGQDPPKGYKPVASLEKKESDEEEFPPFELAKTETRSRQNSIEFPPSALQNAGRKQRGSGAEQSGTAKYGDLTEKRVYDVASESFMKCYDRGLPLIICPLFLTTYGDPVAPFGVKHANLLFFRRETNSFEVFEPYGSYLEISEENEPESGGTKWRDEAITNFVSTINSKYGTSFVYTPITKSCPFLGLQILEASIGEKMPQEGEGYCGVWNLFFTELILTNPKLTQRQITDELFGENLIGDESRLRIGRRLRNIIRGYVYLIYEVLEKYFSFIIKDQSIRDIFNNFIENKDTYESFIKVYTDIEMDFIKSGLNFNEWVNQIDLTDRSKPPLYLEILVFMDEHDIFSDLIPRETKKCRSGGGIRRKSKKIYKCLKQTSKKYLSRNSPPYSASQCRGDKMLGNDGKLYISLSGPKSGVYKWYPYSETLVKSNQERIEKEIADGKLRRRNLKKLNSTRKYKKTHKRKSSKSSNKSKRNY